jgi:cell division septum initiation protein DivIVA
MAKKDKKNAKKDKGREPTDVVDAVRGAVERTFQATSGGTDAARDRGRSLLDDVANAAQRIRESFDDLRVLEDVRGLRAEIEALSRRVAELEKSAAKPAGTTAAGKPARTTSAGTKTAGAGAAAAAKPAAGRRTPAARSTSGRSTTARKAPAKPSAARTAARTTGSAKPKPASAKASPARRTAASRKS